MTIYDQAPMPYFDGVSFCSKCGAYRGPSHPGGPPDPRKCPLEDCAWEKEKKS